MINRDNVLIKNGVLLKAGGLVVKDNKILLVSSNSKDFVIPKGHVEKGEKVEECAIREIKEETGYKVKIIKKLPFIEYTNYTINQLIRLQYYLFEIIGGKEEAEENTCLQWFSLAGAIKANPYNNEQEIIRKAYE